MTKEQLKKLVEYPVVFIENDANGKKQCHFSMCGYIDGADDHPELVEYVGFIIPLDQLLDKNPLMYFCSHECEEKQYIKTCKNINELINDYANANDGLTPEPLSIERLSQNTPIGCYILVDECTMFSLGLLNIQYALVSTNGASIDYKQYNTHDEAHDAMVKAFDILNENVYGVDQFASFVGDDRAVLYTEDTDIIWNIIKVFY